MHLTAPESYLAHNYFFAEIGKRGKAIQSPFVFSAGCVTKSVSVLIIVHGKAECCKNHHTFPKCMFSDVTYNGPQGNFKPISREHE